MSNRLRGSGQTTERVQMLPNSVRPRGKGKNSAAPTFCAAPGSGPKELPAPIPPATPYGGGLPLIVGIVLSACVHSE